jgi:hypothetical protein
MKKEVYNKMEEGYGYLGSFAIWGDKINDISIFEREEIIEKIKENIILVGLNISEKIKNKFGNFHSESKYSKDYKLRYAIEGTKIEGGYITDIIKSYEEKIGNNVIRYIKNNKEFLQKNIKSFIEEIKELKNEEIIIIAIGRKSKKILEEAKEEIKKEIKIKNNKIYMITHYSAMVKKEKIREEIIMIEKEIK